MSISKIVNPRPIWVNFIQMISIKFQWGIFGSPSKMLKWNNTKMKTASMAMVLCAYVLFVTWRDANKKRRERKKIYISLADKHKKYGITAYKCGWVCVCDLGGRECLNSCIRYSVIHLLWMNDARFLCYFFFGSHRMLMYTHSHTRTVYTHFNKQFCITNSFTNHRSCPRLALTAFISSLSALHPPLFPSL